MARFVGRRTQKRGMSHIKELIGEVEIGAPLASGRLTMSPLFTRQLRHADYLVLDEALAAGVADVGEVSEQGQVPELLFRNAQTAKGGFTMLPMLLKRPIAFMSVFRSLFPNTPRKSLKKLSDAAVPNPHS